MPFTLTRSILVVLLPGAISVLPYLILFLVDSPSQLSWYENHQTESYFLLFALSVLIGSFYEGVSSVVEVKLDKCIKKSHPELDEEWYSYLCATEDTEAVAYRYVSRRATTMYFEFSMAWTMPVFGYGVAYLLTKIGVFIPNYERFAFILLFWVLAYYFFRQAMGTHSVLSKVRHELHKRRANKALNSQASPAGTPQDGVD